MGSTLCATFASVLTSILLFSLVSGGSWFVRSIGMILLVAVVGAGGRALRLPRLILILAQASAGFFYLVAGSVSGSAFAGIVPVRRAAWDQLYDVVAGGFTQLGEQTLPVAATPGVTFVVVAGVGIMALLVDALAVTYRQPALSGVPLLVVYTVPAVLLPQGLPGASFLLPAVAYLALLSAGSRNRGVRLGIPIAPRGIDSAAPNRSGVLHGPSRRIGVAVLVLAVVIPAGLPGVSAGAFGSNGIGVASGPKTITTLNALVSLRRDLVRPDDFPLLSVRTDSRKPDELYLRTATLDKFDGEEWTAGKREVKRFAADLPEPVGLAASVDRRPVRTFVQVGDRFASDYLPLPYPTTRVDVPGQWRVDPMTGNVISREGREQAVGTAYTVSSLDLSPTADDVDERERMTPYLQPYLELPEIPARVRDLAERISGAADGVLAKSAALQAWFRNPANFTYDLTVRAGTGRAAILDFLDDRRGYCEQFASTMAVMARSIGIPSRVNVGFTAGSVDAEGSTRIVSTRDAHAWPELYLPGIGWTRFEPTPGSATSSPAVPSWLGQDDKPAPAPAPAPTADTVDAASSPDPEPEDAPAAAEATEETIEDAVPVLPGADQGQGGPPRGPLALAALLLGLAAAPAVVRASIRRRRWSVVGVGPATGASPAAAARIAETAWRELRDCAVDLGYPWPEARTPRQSAALLAVEGRLADRGADALTNLCRAVERARYSPAGGAGVSPDVVRTAVEDVRHELAANTDRSARARARLAPKSLSISAGTLGRRARAVLDGGRRVVAGAAKLPRPSRSR